MSTTTAPTPKEPGRWVISKFGPPSVLSWKQFDGLPTPSDDEALVRILVGGIGAVDNIQRVGGYPGPRTEAPGFTPGYDFVGEIVSLGPTSANSSFKVGDRVTSMCMIGAYATHTVISLVDLLKMDPTDDPVKVTALPLNFMTAYGMLKKAGVDLPPGTSVLVGSAAGGVGSAIAQLNTALDMGLTLYGACSPKNFDFIKKLGMVPVDRHSADLPGVVKELTGGKGVDVAFDAAGSEKSMRDSFAATKDGTGSLIVIGVLSSIAPGGAGFTRKTSETFDFLEKQILPRSKFFAVTYDYCYPQRDAFRKDFDMILQTVRAGKLSPLIGKLFKLEDAVKVNELLANGAPFEGKMEFLVDSEIAKLYKL